MKKLGISRSDQHYISESEVFPTEHRDVVYVDCIANRCKVHTLQEYDNLQTTDECTFFSRANYDVMERKLEPAFENWTRYCVCQKPLNPD